MEESLFTQKIVKANERSFVRCNQIRAFHEEEVRDNNGEPVGANQKRMTDLFGYIDLLEAALKEAPADES